MKKLAILILTGCLTLSAFSQDCLSDGITFRTQEQIDNFQKDYPNCTKIIGTVSVWGDEITNVKGLINVTAIKGSLYIGGMYHNFPSLTSLKGFSNLEIIEGNFQVNNCDNLVSLDGLEKLSSIGGYLQIGGTWSKSTNGTKGNCSLTNICALHNLLYVGKNVCFQGNYSLKSLEGLESLTSVGGDFLFNKNRKIKNLDPLQNLTKVNGDIEITKNIRLESIKGISNIDPKSIHNLSIGSNPSLTFCEANFICSYLSNIEGDVTIFKNTNGCNNEVEVMIACGNPTSIDTIQIETSLTAHPNPFKSTTAITFGLEQPTTVQLIINDFLGKKVQVNECIMTEGKQEIIWDASGLPYGIYFCTLKTGNKFETMKLLKTR